jgi:Uma2 family endonuclease
MVRETGIPKEASVRRTSSCKLSNILSSVPPPDLVVEADLTSSSLDKLTIYASLGVAEVWRYAGGRPDILGLRGEVYERMAQSRFLPPLTSEDLIRFVEEGLRRERPEWVRGGQGPGGPGPMPTEIS